MLRQQEILALELIFRGEDKLSRAIKKCIGEAESVGWEETGVGFCSTIKLNNPLSEIPEVRMWSYAFDHPDFPFGGVFNCMIINENEIELEGVTLGGIDWPYPIDPRFFSDIS